MTSSHDDESLEKALADAFPSPPEADFDTWRREHRYAVASLDPQRFHALVRRRKLMNRFVALAAAAAVVVCVGLGVAHFSASGPGAEAFAQTLAHLEKAKTITWKITFYEHITSADGKRTWMQAETRQCAFKAPGLYREARLDDQGQATWVQITDVVKQKELRMNPVTKEATLRELAFAMQDPRGPFVWIQKELQDAGLQWVEKRKTANGEANVFRHAFYDQSNGRDWSYDFWLDSQSKQLVEVHVPGADIFDPDKDPARNTPPEEEYSLGTAIGFVQHAIAFDAQVDDALFRLEPPEGYVVTTERPPRVTEQEMVDYLGILADYNGKTFPDQVFPFAFSSDRINKSLHKPEADRTPAEQKLLDTMDHYKRASLNLMPTGQFVEKSTAANSFRYLGKGVKLGDKDRIVCWYRLKGATTYRVVYGDLSVKDMAEKDLPLPVQP